MPPNQADLFDDDDVIHDVDHSIATKDSTKQAAHQQLVDLFPNYKDPPCDFLDQKRRTPTSNFLSTDTVATAQRGETNAIHRVETALNLVKDLSDISEFNTVDVDYDVDIDIDIDIDHSIAMEESTTQVAQPFDLLDDDDGQGTNTMVPSVEMTTTLLHQSLSSYPSHHNQFQTSSMNLLGPIITEEEERHVQFAGEMVMHYPLLTGVFVDAVTVIDIPHVSDYTIEEKRNIWYTRQEMIQMKQICLHTVHDILTQHQQKHNCSIEESVYCCSFFLRGLERYVDHYQSMTNKSTTTTRRSGISCTGRRSSEQRQQQRQRERQPSSRRSPPSNDGGVASVLVEQYDQRLQCLQTHCVVYGGILDPDRLRHVYETEGKTIESLQEAQQLAQQDETDVHEYCTKEFETFDSIYPHDDDDDNHDDDDYYHHHCKNRISNDNTIIRNNIMMNYNKTATLFDVLGVKTLLHTLITPFIEVRRGDMVVGVDHHHAGEWI